MLETAVQGICRQLLQKEYPHTEYPALLRAVITSAAKGSELREPVEAVNTETGERGRYEVIRHTYTYTVRVLTDAEIDAAYPPLPGIRSSVRYNVGDTVIIGLPGGALQPVILGGG